MPLFQRIQRNLRERVSLHARIRPVHDGTSVLVLLHPGFQEVRFGQRLHRNLPADVPHEAPSQGCWRLLRRLLQRRTLHARPRRPRPLRQPGLPAFRLHPLGQQRKRPRKPRLRHALLRKPPRQSRQRLLHGPTRQLRDHVLRGSWPGRLLAASSRRH